MKTLEEYIEEYGEVDGTRKWKRAERSRQYYETNKERVIERTRQWQAEHKEQVSQYREAHREKYRKAVWNWITEHPMEHRANQLLGHYRRNDRNQNRGDCTLTKQWILEKIFTSHCIYCGETDWRKLGADRINNSKPHTPENVVCSCKRCNDKRQKMNFLDYALSIGAKESDGLIIK